MKIIFSTILNFILLSVSAMEVAPNPGTTGINAFNWVQNANDTEIADSLYIDIERSFGEDNLGTSVTDRVRLVFPIQELVEIGMDLPIEEYRNFEESVQDYDDITHQDGRAVGDLNLYFKMKALEETKFTPEMAAKITVKSASGGLREHRRYTDSAGYGVSIMVGKTIFERLTEYNKRLIVEKVRIIVETSFLAWDTNYAEQNDAGLIRFGTSVSGFDDSLFLHTNAVYYKGWQEDDEVAYLQAQLEYQIPETNFSIYVHGKYGLTEDAPEKEVGVGVRYYLNKK